MAGLGRPFDNASHDEAWQGPHGQSARTLQMKEPLREDFAEGSVRMERAIVTIEENTKEHMLRIRDLRIQWDELLRTAVEVDRYYAILD